MKIPKPRFELARVYSDGTMEAEIVPVTDIPLDTTTGRRGFLATALTAAAVLGFTVRAQGGNTEDTEKKRNALTTEKADCGGLLSHQGRIYSLAISPDSRTLASFGGGSIKLWDLHNGKLRQTITEGGDLLSFTPDGHTLIFSSGSNIALWDLVSGTLRQTMTRHTSAITALVVSPDGRTLASGDWDGIVLLWDLPTHSLRQTMVGHSSGISALLISPDGRTLASGDKKGFIKLWDISPPSSDVSEFRKIWNNWVRTHPKTWQGHESIYEIAIGPDGLTLAVSGTDNSPNGSIKLYGFPEGLRSKTIPLGPGLLGDILISPDGRTLVLCGSVNIELWDFPSWTHRKTINTHTKSIWAHAISADGSTLASGGEDQTIKLWDLPSGEFRGCLIDLSATPSDIKGMTYRGQNQLGQSVTYTLPCGSPIPSGAICTCNCVPGSYRSSRVQTQLLS